MFSTTELAKVQEYRGSTQDALSWQNTDWRSACSWCLVPENTTAHYKDRFNIKTENRAILFLEIYLTEISTDV